ncbi:Bacteriophage abortive infection AbiH [Porphyromonadaceae bacterium KH3R12]|uniref:AbiH family protein n=1 Tax=Proteiniphilum sp. TaxID=1926877 RepID=UPI000895B8D9|nr:AbiH family protein [Proteiniphilum sp.]MDY9918547.1 AbiH family protein [Proteiniphilum sp.]OJV86281.1 MAG: hypothetical protein BGO34_04600 [Bacteroidia bacterium 44-10]SDZ90442.1 Bacteriophage abortive infection AbiH [Porphyromonadaceae bacterium KH3R12]
MNRIILIGNGFDLAHGLKTSYKDFIDDYWSNIAKHLKESKPGTFSDDSVNINYITKSHDPFQGNPINAFSDIEEMTYKEICRRVSLRKDVNVELKNLFFKRISDSCSLNNWVDIEKEFYRALKECLNNRLKVKSKTFQSQEYFSIEDLNRDFERIKQLLIDYLYNIQIPPHLFKPDIFNRIVSEFGFRDFTQTYKKQYIRDKIKYISSIVNSEDDPLKKSDENIKREFKDRERINQRGIERILNTPVSTDCFPDLLLNNLLFVNFNYTSTPEIYKKEIYEYNRSFQKLHDNQPFINTEDIYIHGKLNRNNNPIIFGFGDEIDEDYSKIENLDDNKYLENIKSTRYHETDNYKRLLEYIDSDYFQIFIFGHSCGLSDRTLLSTLFNHDNCVSIKPFYHKKEDGSDNYSDLVRNISRHFKNKASLRDKVVNKAYCEPLTGSK